MARYIKVNRLVASYLQLDTERNAVKDGNYLLWQNDMLAFGSLVELDRILAEIGGLALTPREAREEQDGITCRTLPVATDTRFRLQSASESSEVDEDTVGKEDGTVDATEDAPQESEEQQDEHSEQEENV